jgi:glycerophosphoryl diester phosphodiesterase
VPLEDRTELRGPIVLAHRGARLVAPDNSLEAFEEALRVGADGIETDVHCTADGHVVLAHDPHGRGTARVDRAIVSCTLAELQSWDIGCGPDVACAPRPARMPTLEAALHAFPATFFNVDIKVHTPAAIEAVLAAIARCEAAARVLLTSFSTAVMRRVRARGYAGPTGIAQAEAIAVLLLRRPGPVRAQRLQLPERFGPLPLDRRWVTARAHAAGLGIDYWVINDPARAATLLALGADGIVTDDPAAIVPVARHARRQSGSLDHGAVRPAGSGSG